MNEPAKKGIRDSRGRDSGPRTADDGATEVEIPDKLYFKIREVARIADLPPYVLRFWETEFRGIRPKRTPSGQRMYRKSDVLKILKIKHLLHEKRYTIQGARQHLKASRKRKSASRGGVLDEIRAELEKIREMLV
ncbi:MAG: MerR family transcriptional regulator [Desulfobacterales bacterium]|nr:MerR family transcriptional regulator [Desulfobacterales bacterium]